MSVCECHSSFIFVFFSDKRMNNLVGEMAEKMCLQRELRLKVGPDYECCECAGGTSAIHYFLGRDGASEGIELRLGGVGEDACMLL